MADNRVIRLRPYHYIHVLDSNVTHVESGPKTFVRKDHEQVVLQSTQMVKKTEQEKKRKKRGKANKNAKCKSNLE